MKVQHEATDTHIHFVTPSIAATLSAALECRPSGKKPPSSVRTTLIVKGGKFQHACFCQHFIVRAVDCREMSERLGHLHNDAFVPRMPFALCVAQPLCLPRKRICRLLSVHSRAEER